MQTEGRPRSAALRTEEALPMPSGENDTDASTSAGRGHRRDPRKR